MKSEYRISHPRPIYAFQKGINGLTRPHTRTENKKFEDFFPLPTPQQRSQTVVYEVHQKNAIHNYPKANNTDMSCNHPTAECVNDIENELMEILGTTKSSAPIKPQLPNLLRLKISNGYEVQQENSLSSPITRSTNPLPFSPMSGSFKSEVHRPNLQINVKPVSDSIGSKALSAGANTLSFPFKL